MDFFELSAIYVCAARFFEQKSFYLDSVRHFYTTLFTAELSFF